MWLGFSHKRCQKQMKLLQNLHTTVTMKKTRHLFCRLKIRIVARELYLHEKYIELTRETTIENDYNGDAIDETKNVPLRARFL